MLSVRVAGLNGHMAYQLETSDGKRHLIPAVDAPELVAMLLMAMSPNDRETSAQYLNGFKSRGKAGAKILA